MTTKQYNDALARLGLGHIEAARWLGYTLRQAYKIKNGVAPVPPNVARILKLVEHYHLSPEEASAIWGKA